jgi:KDO2-lipid IV(A) lauroyltransferase
MIAWVAYRMADLVVRLLPAALADRVCVALARLVFHAGLPARRAQEANLARLLGDATRAAIRSRARESFEHFALALSDVLRLDSMAPEALAGAIEIHGGEHLEAARAAGRGVILVSAHLGNWEWGAAWLATRGLRVHLVARAHGSPGVERLFRRLRRGWGVSVLPADAPWSEAARALRRGEWVAVMADRPALGLGKAGPASRSNSACAFAATLARRTGALVLPAVMIHLPGRRYAACFEPALALARTAAGARAGDAGPGADVGAILRRVLRRHPGQWCAFEPVPEALH